MDRPAHLLGSALLAALSLLPFKPIASQTLFQSAPPALALYNPAPARDSFPALLRNTFTDGTSPDPVTLSVLFPGNLTPDCPNGSIEPMRDIRAFGDGHIEGTVVPDSLSPHSHLFGETFSFTADLIWDWQLATSETEGRFYGAYRSRNFVTWAPDGGGVMITLMPEPLPADWN